MLSRKKIYQNYKKDLSEKLLTFENLVNETETEEALANSSRSFVNAGELPPVSISIDLKNSFDNINQRIENWKNSSDALVNNQVPISKIDMESIQTEYKAILDSLTSKINGNN